MKRFLSVLLTCLLFQLAYSQEPIVKWGESIDEPPIKAAKIQNIMLLDDPAFYYAYRNTEGFVEVPGNWLEKYDAATHKMIFSKEISSAEGVMGNGINFKKIIPLKDKFLLFYTGYTKATKEAPLLARIMSADGDVDKTDIKLETMPAEGWFKQPSFHYVVSPDKSKLLVVSNYPAEKKVKAKIRLRVFDTQNMKELGNKETELAYDGKKGCIMDALVDNQGNSYVIDRYANENRKFEFNLYTFNLATSEWKATPLDMGEKTISEQSRFLFSPTGDAIFTGFLYTKVERTPTDLFYIRINPKTLAIEANTKLGYGDDAMKEKEDASFPYYKLRGVEVQSNGNALVIGEYEDSREVPPPPDQHPGFGPGGPNQPGMGGGNTGYERVLEYLTQNIKVASIRPDGSRAWVRTIVKEEKYNSSSNYKRFDSFVYGLSNDRLYILYNKTGINCAMQIDRNLYDGWKDADGVHRYRDFYMRTGNPTFLYVVEPNGDLTFGDRTFGFPLYNFQKGNPFIMNLNSAIFCPLPDGILMMDEMPDGKKYQFGKIFF